MYISLEYMGASLLIPVPRKTIWSHHEKTNQWQRRTTTTDGGRRRTTTDGGRTDDGRRHLNLFFFSWFIGDVSDPFFLSKNHRKSSDVCFPLICLPPGWRLLLTPGMWMGQIGTNIGSIHHPIYDFYWVFMFHRWCLWLFFIKTIGNHQTRVLFFGAPWHVPEAQPLLQG